MAVYRWSRFAHSISRHDDNGNFYLGGRAPFRQQNYPDNRYHIAKEGDTWFTLAGFYFRAFPRACGLFWVLCDYQNPPVLDPTLKIEPGITLVIPSERVVRSVIFDRSRRRLTG